MALYDLGRKLAAWERAGIMPGWNPAFWRIDCDGRMIFWPDYGDRKSPYGWEIDHIFPFAVFRWDALPNLRARHWQGNASAGGLLGALLNEA